LILVATVEDETWMSKVVLIRSCWYRQSSGMALGFCYGVYCLNKQVGAWLRWVDDDLTFDMRRRRRVRVTSEQQHFLLFFFWWVWRLRTYWVMYKVNTKRTVGRLCTYYQKGDHEECYSNNILVTSLTSWLFFFFHRSLFFHSLCNEWKNSYQLAANRGSSEIPLCIRFPIKWTQNVRSG
jgi:hypothetical protein